MLNEHHLNRNFMVKILQNYLWDILKNIIYIQERKVFIPRRHDRLYFLLFILLLPNVFISDFKIQICISVCARRSIENINTQKVDRRIISFRFVSFRFNANPFSFHFLLGCAKKSDQHLKVQFFICRRPGWFSSSFKILKKIIMR